MNAKEFEPAIRCLREPIPEIFAAAAILEAAADSHLAKRWDVANALFAAADLPQVAEWTDSVWGKANPGKARFRSLANQPVKSSIKAEQTIPTLIKWAVINRDGFNCRLCGIPVIRKEIRNFLKKLYPSIRWGKPNSTQHSAFQCMWLQYDHVIPQSRGRANSEDNLIITCAPCNNGRGNWTFEEINIIDPRTIDVTVSDWDGLERVMKKH